MQGIRAKSCEICFETSFGVMFAPKCRSVTISEQTPIIHICTADTCVCIYRYTYTVCLHVFGKKFNPSINVHVSVDLCMDICIDIWIEKQK